ncbi:MAG TPA: CDP-diacylglycerol--glycerol-3-phosphate 3-phosphatidyltransferase [Bacilli bacterium]|nr:CDP-diacylglycerol--glycerol-3-phosphate 3-phosphatidyltransferase [Bacilli bacterium]
MNLPNKITIGRVVMVGILIVLLAFPYTNFGISIPIISGDINLIYLIGGIIFLIASFSDFLDGYIARKFNLVTDFGKFMDPVADKVLVDASLIFLMIRPVYAASSQIVVMPLIVIIFIARDLIVDAMRLVASGKKVVVAANIFGKLKTVAQMIAVTFLFLNDWPFSFLGLPQYLTVTDLLVYLAALLSLASGVIYIIQNKRVFQDNA